MTGAGASIENRFFATMARLLGPRPPSAIGVAVSGGGDSMALMHLAARWAQSEGATLRVVTVDHGLREDSAREARFVKARAEKLGLSHDTLRWSGWDGTGNLQDAAREARLAHIGRWLGRADHVFYGHTQDDQAETVLMRLKRGSGVEGLAGMEERRWVARPREAGRAERFEILRPLLAESREDLRAYLRDIGAEWVEDPSNEDLRFERVRARRILHQLSEWGLDAAALAATAARMARAREALSRRAAEIAERIRSTHHGDILFDRAGLADTERDTQLRLLSAALCEISSNPYRPRASALEALLDTALSGGGGTLHGCRLMVSGGWIRLCREFKAVEEERATAGPDSCWDRRWRLTGARIDGLEIRALGHEGLAQMEMIAKDAPPRESLIAQPAIFDGDRLIACEAAGFGPEHTVKPCNDVPGCVNNDSLNLPD